MAMANINGRTVIIAHTARKTATMPAPSRAVTICCRVQANILFIGRSFVGVAGSAPGWEARSTAAR